MRLVSLPDMDYASMLDRAATSAVSRFIMRLPCPEKINLCGACQFVLLHSIMRTGHDLNYVSQRLGKKNNQWVRRQIFKTRGLTLRGMSEIAFAIGAHLDFKLLPQESSE